MSSFWIFLTVFLKPPTYSVPLHTEFYCNCLVTDNTNKCCKTLVFGIKVTTTPSHKNMDQEQEITRRRVYNVPWNGL